MDYFNLTYICIKHESTIFAMESYFHFTLEHIIFSLAYQKKNHRYFAYFSSLLCSFPSFRTAFEFRSSICATWTYLLRSKDTNRQKSHSNSVECVQAAYIKKGTYIYLLSYCKHFSQKRVTNRFFPFSIHLRFFFAFYTSILN